MAVGCERLLSAMITGGVPAQVAADALTLDAAADVYEGWLMARRFDDGSGRTVEEVGVEHFEGVGRLFRALPAERFPFVARHVGELVTEGGDERFVLGLETFIAGISAHIPG